MNDIESSKNSYWSNVGLVLSGTLVAQAIPVLGSLVIARLFLPESFGEFAVWLSLVMLFSLIITGRYEMSLAIVEGSESKKIGVISIIILAFALSIPLFLITLLFWSLFFSEDIKLIFLLLILPASIAQAMINIWDFWAGAEGNFKKLNAIRIFQSSSILSCQILLGMINASSMNLILGQLFGVVLTVVFCVFNMRISIQDFKINYSNNEIRKFYKKYKRFLIYTLPASTMNTLGVNIPVILIAIRFGSEIAGFFALTIRVLGAPISVIGRSILDVFRKQAASAYRKKGNCKSEYLQTFWALSIFSVVISIVGLLFINDIFILAFGDVWATSGLIAVWLIPMFALRFIASPLSYIFFLTQKQNIDLIWQSTLFISTIIAFTLFETYRDSIVSYSYFYSFLYIIYLFLSYKLSLGNKISSQNLDHDI